MLPLRILIITGICFTYLMSAAEEPCSVEPKQTFQQGTAESYVDQYRSQDRNQHILFTDHLSNQSVEVVIKLGELVYQKKWAEAQAHIHNYISLRSQWLAVRRLELEHIINANSEEPFSYIGIEADTSQKTRDGFFSLFETLEQTYHFIKDKLEGHVSIEQINDFFLATTDTLHYILVTRNSLLNISSILFTEHPTPWAEYYSNRHKCLPNLDLLVANTHWTAEERNIISIYRDYNYNAEIGQPIENILNMEHYLAAEEALRNNITINEDFKQTFEKLIQPCRDLHSNQRDHFVALSLLKRSPKGKGLIFRGSAHRKYLNEEFLKQCLN